MRRRQRRSRKKTTALKRSEERFVNAVLKNLDADLAAGRLTGPQDLHDRVMAAMTAKPPLALHRHPHHFRRLMRKTIARVVQPSVILVMEGAAKDARRELAQDKDERIGFEARLQERWGEALGMLTLFRFWCLEAGIAFHERHEQTEDDWVHAALTRLHARACLITAEILVLLRAGFASGAHARWRSAHEIDVVALLIAEHGQDIAERYLLHEVIESHRATADYQQHAVRLGYEPLTAQELADLETTKEALIARFGSAYSRPYGWAANALNNVDPKFGDIEAAVALDHLRPYYRMASYPTHAGPKAIAFDLGLNDDHDVMLAGPSNAGLADPGHSIAITLLRATVSLLNRDPDMGDLVTMTFLQATCDAIGGAFLRADQALRDDEELIARQV